MSMYNIYIFYNNLTGPVLTEIIIIIMITIPQILFFLVVFFLCVRFRFFFVVFFLLSDHEGVWTDTVSLLESDSHTTQCCCCCSPNGLLLRPDPGGRRDRRTEGQTEGQTITRFSTEEEDRKEVETGEKKEKERKTRINRPMERSLRRLIVQHNTTPKKKKK